MKKASTLKELNALLVGSNSSRKNLVGNIILGRPVFEETDLTSTCERGEGEVCGRRVTLVKAPGWLRGYELCDTPELFKTEAILSGATPGLHGFILVINVELPFEKTHKKATKKHLQHFFGDKVWDHTIVVFTHEQCLDHKTIEGHIRNEGRLLQSLLQACGHRYHFLCDNSKDNKEQIKELFEKIEAMVAKNSCYEPDSTLIKNTESKRKEVEQKAEELRLKTQQQRQKLRNLLTGPKQNLSILMVGWVFSGKSATGNSILSTTMFQAGDRTVKASRQSGEVDGRRVVIVDTPGWWKFFPAAFNSEDMKKEILNGVSLCSPSPNVILLAMSANTSFTDEQKKVTENNMCLLGDAAWRHVIVVFTFGDALGEKTIEQHIASEGKPLRWLIEKCGNRYHVLNNLKPADQVNELLEKMEEMVAGNSYFCLSSNPDAEDPPPQEVRGDKETESKDEGAAKIIEQLNIEWDRKNWDKTRNLTGSMNGLPPNLSDVEQKSATSEEEDEHQQCQTCAALEEESIKSDDAAGPVVLNTWRKLLEKEWSRREVAMELSSLTQFYKPASEPDSDRLQESREKVKEWLKSHQTSEYGTSSETSWKSEEKNKKEKRRKEGCSKPSQSKVVAKGKKYFKQN